MKTKITVLLFTILFSISIGFSQEGIKVTETSTTINDVSGNAIQTSINRAEQKTIAKEWKSIMKDYDGDVDIKGNEIIATEVKIESISPMTLSVYAQINKISAEKKEFIVIFFNGDKSISSQNDVAGFTAAKEIVKRFALSVSREATNEYNEVQLEILEGLTKSLENLKKEQEDAAEDIEDAKKEIEKAKETIKDKEYAIEDAKKKQTEMIKKIEGQKEITKAAKSEVELFN